MTVASVTTDIHIGPYIIPSNAQNMIMNFYAGRLGLQIELVVPEPIFSFKYATTIWLHKQYRFKDILLVSLHQLPKTADDQENILMYLPDVVFHFALEGESGVLAERSEYWTTQVRLFDRQSPINGKQLGWLGLHSLMANSQSV
jgi:sporadic carbohydrate cluster protein (TIGR04323 family)